MGKVIQTLNAPENSREKMAYWVGNRPKFASVSESGILHGYNAPAMEVDWFDEFIQRYVREGDKKVYHFYSVFGSKLYCKRHRFPHSFFFSSETVHTGKLLFEYDDYCLDYVDLSMTYDYVDAPNYLRFPQWIIWLFKPVLDKDYISGRIKEFNEARSTG